MMYQKPKGTRDILPGESEKWQYVEQKAREVFKRYQYKEIRTPIFEHLELITRSVGESTDIVTKEMYDFKDKGGRHITLRPEGTAPVVRAYVENKLYGPEHTNPYKVYYMGPMFRYERPQAGRLRQFHQIGIEVLGADNPAIDVEGISVALALFSSLGLKKFKLVINSLGDQDSRQAHRAALLDYLTPLEDQLSSDSKRRLKTNPLRILDSKEEQDQPIVADAPSILDYLNPESTTYFETVKEMLTALDIPFEVDSNMVRGLDYYNHTIFEIMSDSEAFQGVNTTICAGGRYNGLVEEIGGPSIPGFGFGSGIERIILTLEAEQEKKHLDNAIDIYVVGMGERSSLETLKLTEHLRRAGFSVERDYLARKAKAQFKQANKLGAAFTVILGDEELELGQATIKNMATSKEVHYNLNALYNQPENIFQELGYKSKESEK
ncbi:histidine--tRNA ligase [Candidatus Enterococcus mansonii]|uniref:Histidine--tRNA ligase n=1 Tax=Candidatus Enterococcus mansonii TaxID=1834181 RepID=A0A242CDM2_9ENTE|nr:histidine--tRNA ligase [Enterococcus sp. 4G2_DIV0659]OTO08020.1 histidine-tRNA ligase [Enterococcus sp. 4G2_DIV0659]